MDTHSAQFPGYIRGRIEERLVLLSATVSFWTVPPLGQQHTGSFSWNSVNANSLCSSVVCEDAYASQYSMMLK